MNQNMALAIMLSGESVFLTGPAGSGKTFVLNQFIEKSKKQGKKVAITATTGIAATHLNGNTIHSWSGIGIKDFLEKGFMDKYSKSKKENIAKTDILIIDEISMLHDFRLDMVDEVCKAFKENKNPFGGIQVVLSGDFFQLPPVDRDNKRNNFAVSSKSWINLDPVICYLTDQFRQDDEELFEILNLIRAGEINDCNVSNLLERIDKIPETAVTELHTTNIDVDTINNKMLDEISSEEFNYQRSTTGSNLYVDSLTRSILAPELLRLKEGALVMAVKNSNDKKYVNGSLGKVVGFYPETNYPIVKFNNGNEIVVFPDSWELRDGDKKLASVTQIPLRLAWAITIHKAQGMTLDGAVIDLRKAFVEGMGYVALSRVKNLASLYLKGVNNIALQTSNIAQSIDIMLKAKSEKDVHRFNDVINKFNYEVV